MTKRIIVCLLAALLLCGLLTGCGEGDDGRLTVVCTTFPQYDWTRQIVGERTDAVEVVLLVDNGVDLHNYQATTQDIVALAECDLLVYTGGESEAWVPEALSESGGKASTVSLMETLADAAKVEEAVEGMQGHDEDEACEEPEYDEHVWLSLRCAELFCGEIAARLGELDAADAQVYADNAAAYIASLDALDKEYVATVGAAGGKTLLFGDRFPFRYLVDDYGLEYFAAFNGCSAETEASFETVVFLAGKLDELGLGSVIVLESSDRKLAQTIIESSSVKDRQIVVMNAMQSVSADDIDGGMTYLDTMRANLAALTAALG